MNEEIYSEGIVQCFTLEDLTRIFSLTELADMARAGLLQQWLAENFSEEAAETLSADEIVSWSDDELKLALCEILGVNVDELSDFDAQSIKRAIDKRQLKEIFFGAGEDFGTIVTNQRELTDALNAGDVVIYLVGGVFQIPLNKGGVTYYGRENALVEIFSRRDVDFDAAEISLNDLQVFVRHTINVKYSNSTNLIFLRGDKVAREEFVRKIDVYKLLRGRRSFELPENFSRRVKEMTGIVVGKVVFDAKNYDIQRQFFSLKIDWYLDFLTVAQKFAAGKFFGCVVPADFAEKIYETERAQLVYADFCADGDFPAIKRLYLLTSDGARIDILVSDVPAFDEFFDSCQSGSSGGDGYGLELVETFNDEMKNLASVEETPPPKENANENRPRGFFWQIMNQIN